MFKRVDLVPGAKWVELVPGLSKPLRGLFTMTFGGITGNHLSRVLPGLVLLQQDNITLPVRSMIFTQDGLVKRGTGLRGKDSSRKGMTIGGPIRVNRIMFGDDITITINILLVSDRVITRGTIASCILGTSFLLDVNGLIRMFLIRNGARFTYACTRINVIYGLYTIITICFRVCRLALVMCLGPYFIGSGFQYSVSFW